MVYTLTGTNSYRLTAFLKSLKSEFVAKYGESGIENYSGDMLSPEILSNALGGVSLFSQNRLVVLKNVVDAKDLAEFLIKQIESVSDEVTVVIVEPNLDKRTLLYKALKKTTQLHEFADLRESELISWIQAEVKNEGGEINLADARQLYEYCGSDQLRLSNEIHKLVLYETKISNDTIELLVERNPRDTIFELLELAMSGQRERALPKLVALEAARQDPFQIASMLIWQAHILSVVQTAGGLSESEIAKQHKINPYVISKTKRLTAKSSISRLKSTINTIAKLDITLKTNAHDPWRAIEQTLFAL